MKLSHVFLVAILANVIGGLIVAGMLEAHFRLRGERFG